MIQLSDDTLRFSPCRETQSKLHGCLTAQLKSLNNESLEIPSLHTTELSMNPSMYGPQLLYLTQN